MDFRYFLGTFSFSRHLKLKRCSYQLAISIWLHFFSILIIWKIMRMNCMRSDVRLAAAYRLFRKYCLMWSRNGRCCDWKRRPPDLWNTHPHDGAHYNKRYTYAANTHAHTGSKIQKHLFCVNNWKWWSKTFVSFDWSWWWTIFSGVHPRTSLAPFTAPQNDREKKFVRCNGFENGKGIPEIMTDFPVRNRQTDVLYVVWGARIT